MYIRRLFAVLLTAIFLACGLSAYAQADLTERAASFIGDLAAGNYAAAYENSASQMREAIGSADGYAAVWNQLQTYGMYQGIIEAFSQKSGEYDLVRVVCGFEGAKLSLDLIYDADGLLAGLQVASVEPIESPDGTGARTETLMLRAGEPDETEALLTLPEGDGPFPAVILVQGSGPSDRDESAYGLKPFRDLAEGLAARGIASLRYDKYTFAHADLLTGERAQLFTVADEYLLDFAAAVEALDADARVSKIIPVGHSQGAMLMPRLMASAQSGKFAGAALISGTPKHLWEIQYAQNLAAVESLDKETADVVRAQLEIELEKAESLPYRSDEARLTETLFGLSAHYQWDEMSVDAAETAVALGLPLFIAQGQKDWQVPVGDGIDAWRAALADFDGATYALYPNVNHMLQEQTGAVNGDSSDYVGGSGVSEQLIDELAAWILAR